MGFRESFIDGVTLGREIRKGHFKEEHGEKER